MQNKKYKWEVVACDYNSPFLRNFILVNGILKFKELLKVSNPVLGIFSAKNQITYLGDMSIWVKVHDELKNKIIKNYQFFENLIDKTNLFGEKFNGWSEKEIFNANLSTLKNSKLIYLLEQFSEKQASLYTYGVALPILDFNDFSFIEGNLNKYLKIKLSDKDQGEYYRVFTEPENNSFAQDQEEALLRLMSKFYLNAKWRKDIMIGDIEKIKKLYPKFYSLLLSHSLKYGWVYYAYMGPIFDENKFLQFIQDYLNNKVNPNKKIKEIAKRKKDLKILKKKYVRNLKPDKFNLMIIKLAGKLVWAKPRRKDYQSKSYYHIEKLLLEIAKRLSVSINEVRSAPFDILKMGLSGKKIDLKIINSIYVCHCCLPKTNGDVEIIYGKKAERFYLSNIKKNVVESKEADKSGLKGNCACVGSAKGVVRIINTPSDMAKMEKGDILVSTATTPSIVSAMKKAAAIITDEGGLTCHAAIVSRELNIPCVVGVKIATSVLKDGDMVEVNADKGIVKIIK